MSTIITKKIRRKVGALYKLANPDGAPYLFVFPKAQMERMESCKKPMRAILCFTLENIPNLRSEPFGMITCAP